MSLHAHCFIATVLYAALLAQTNASDAPKTGGVSGVAVESKTGDGVRKAIVIVRRNQEPGIGTTTDAAGKFGLRDLEPGTYTLTVEHTGYVVARGSEHKNVTVTAGETTSDVKIELLRTGAISGRVLDADGEPVAGVNIQLLPARRIKKDRPIGYAMTDDRGEYRAFNIAPGEYKVSATYTPRFHDMQVRMQRPASEKGGTDDAYPTVDYPGTITVTPGAELHGVDIQLMRGHAVRVRGRVISPDGSPPGMFTMVALEPRGAARQGGQSRTALVSGSKGEFELMDVLPGAYRLSATSGAMNQDGQLTGHRTLEVVDVDVENVEVTVGPLRKIMGRVVAPEGRQAPSGLVIVLSSREPGDTQGGGMSQLAANGSFSMDHVPPGDYDVIVGSIASSEDDLYISAIHMGDVDALAEGVHIGGGAPASVDIMLKANGGTLECTVKDEKEAALYGAHVIVAPDEPKRRRLALYGDCRTDANGTCKIAGIAPGEYHVYAFAADTEIDYRDPDSFAPFEKYGKPVKFSEGQRHEVELRAVAVE